MFFQSHVVHSLNNKNDFLQLLKFNILKLEFFLSSYVYYVTRGFIASTCAFNLLTRALNLPTGASNLPSLLTRGFEHVTRRFELVTREF